ncbi:hypothetical protein [Actinomadura opuntiae]|uniref:hypothetical protein n=1 Tax=Actinomadura sp. OS1-43 TaxID=604315 RepID=UPI00255A7969|nr:hypothetical protein [Actinomadura sp. OS1-43]MDL4819119.1 hypothetical protein [Actinomadura sp. OS1-43]
MSTQTKIAIGGVVVGLITLFILPAWVSLVIILVALGIPVAGYLMLDPSQRKRLRAQGRKRLGS